MLLAASDATPARPTDDTAAKRGRSSVVKRSSVGSDVVLVGSKIRRTGFRFVRLG